MALFERIRGRGMYGPDMSHASHDLSPWQRVMINPSVVRGHGGATGQISDVGLWQREGRGPAGQEGESHGPGAEAGRTAEE
jgi:hypothetical protein